MAMVCVTGCRECDGCCDCQEPRQEDILGRCSVCGDPVLAYEDRYEFPDGEIVHDDCALEYIRKNFFRAGE